MRCWFSTGDYENEDRWGAKKKRRGEGRGGEGRREEKRIGGPCYIKPKA